TSSWVRPLRRYRATATAVHAALASRPMIGNTITGGFHDSGCVGSGPRKLARNNPGKGPVGSVATGAARRWAGAGKCRCQQQTRGDGAWEQSVRRDGGAGG